MWNTFKYTIRFLVGQRDILIWTLLFPLILSLLFNAMFSGLGEASAFEPIPVAIVNDEAYQNASTFSQMIDALEEEGDEGMIVAQRVETVEAAKAAVDEGACGYITIDDEGVPFLHFPPEPVGNVTTSMAAINRTILADIVNSYLHARETVIQVAQNSPQYLADPSFVSNLYERAQYTQGIAITANKADQGTRYFYALLGFAALMGANVALTIVSRLQPNLSPLGARRAVGAISRTKTLFASMTAAWLSAFVCLLVAFMFMRYVLAISFGGRDGLCILGLATASLMSTAFGAFLGAIPKISEGAKAGMLTGITCLLALFAGLYGEPAMNLSDMIARKFPVLSAINPVRQVTDLFYDLYNYTSLDPFFQTTAILLVTTFVLGLAAAFLMRRQRYASI